MSTVYTDGTFTTARQNGPRRISYPFINAPIPDGYAIDYERDMVVLAANFSPTVNARTNYTNSQQQSNVFTNSSIWLKEDAVLTANVLANPWNGNVSVARVNENATTAPHGLQGSGTYPQLSLTSISAIVRGGLGRDWIYLVTVGEGGTEPRAFFNVTSGTVGTAIGCTSKITALGNSFFWAQLDYTPSSTGFFHVYASTGDNVVANYAGDTAKGFYIAQAQFTQGAATGPLILTTTVARTVTVPNLESGETLQGLDPFAFAVEETPLTTSRGSAEFKRSYSRVPSPQIVPSSKYFDRPVMDDVFIASTAWAVSFDELQNFSWVFTSRKTVSSVGAVTLGTTPIDAAAQPIAALTSDTFSVTDSASSTQTLALNTAVSSIYSTLASMTITGLSVTGGYDFLKVAWATNVKYISTSSQNVTVDGSVSSGSITFQQLRPAQTAADTQKPNQNPSLRTINCTGHGGVVGDKVVFWNGNKIVAKSIVMAVASADAFSVIAADVDGKDIVITDCGMSSDAAACYVNGPKVCTTRHTTSFYLPGYTLGIATYADIPTVTVYSDPVSWLGRIIAAPTGFAAIEVSDVTQWKGAILQQEIVEIQMDDALDTVTP